MLLIESDLPRRRVGRDASPASSSSLSQRIRSGTANTATGDLGSDSSALISPIAPVLPGVKVEMETDLQLPQKRGRLFKVTEKEEEGSRKREMGEQRIWNWSLSSREALQISALYTVAEMADYQNQRVSFAVTVASWTARL